jgi:hypothetical protein
MLVDGLTIFFKTSDPARDRMFRNAPEGNKSPLLRGHLHGWDVRKINRSICGIASLSGISDRAKRNKVAFLALWGA